MLHIEKLPVLYAALQELMLHSEMKGGYDGMGAHLGSTILEFYTQFCRGKTPIYTSRKRLQYMF